MRAEARRSVPCPKDHDICSKDHDIASRVSNNAGVKTSPDEGTPLGQGPAYGLLYCLAGAGAAVVAHAVGGWGSLPIWLIAALLCGAGLWTSAFTGGLLLLFRYAERRSRRR